MSENGLLEAPPSADAQPDATSVIGVTISSETARPAIPIAPEPAGVTASAVNPAACDCADQTQPGARAANIYAIGTVGFDSSEHRDSFRQLMPRVDPATGRMPPRPGPQLHHPTRPDANQLVNYLNANPWESTKLIWTLNLELTPIYAIEAETAYADYVYQLLRAALAGKSLPDDDDDYVSRVSIAGVVTKPDRPAVLRADRPGGQGSAPWLVLVEQVEAHRGGDQCAYSRDTAGSTAGLYRRSPDIAAKFLGQGVLPASQSGPNVPVRARSTTRPPTRSRRHRASCGRISAVERFVVPVPGSTGIYRWTPSQLKKPILPRWIRIAGTCRSVFDPENDRRARMVPNRHRRCQRRNAGQPRPRPASSP